MVVAITKSDNNNRVAITKSDGDADLHLHNNRFVIPYVADGPVVPLGRGEKP